ncbi:HVA22-like protein a [Morus notabilis]|uniref:HVA22-like protein a n=1 Tax=Morus notabilis TaxID=981085 RepID=W9SI44_9ROSA|nr:HVA22-like protein a [Morus notabilis]
MGLAGFLLFFVKYCVDVLAWPLLALTYPLFPFWPYLRLIIVCLLEIPYFDGAFYVYKQIMCSLFSMDFQSIINWFTIKPKESSVEKEKILAEVEKYVRENGTEALEKIIAPKSGSSKNIEVRDIQALSVSSTDNGRVNQPNSKEPHEARKDIKAVVEIIEKNQVKETSQPNSKEPHEARKDIKAVVELIEKNQVKETTQPNSKEPHEVRKDIKAVVEVIEKNQVKETTQPNSKEPHEARKDIKAVVEVIEKNQVKETSQVNRGEPQLTQTKNKTALPTETREKVSEVQAGRELPETPVSRIVQKEWTCAICQVTTESEADFISHLSDKKHKGIMNEAANAKNQPVFPEVAPSYSPEKYAHPAEEDPGKSSDDQTVFPKVVFSPKISGQSTGVPLPGIIFNASSNRWEPGVITSEKLQGKEKNAVPASSTSKSNECKQETKTSLSNSEMKQKSGIKHEEKGHGKKAMKQKTGTVGVKDLSLWCRVCNIWCPSKVHMKAHLRGKKHLNEVQLLAEK